MAHWGELAARFGYRGPPEAHRPRTRALIPDLVSAHSALPVPGAARVSLGRVKAGRTTNIASIIPLLGAFVGAALVMGLLGAGLIMPTVGAAGAITRTGVDMFDALPSEFSAASLSQQSKILDAKGSVIATPHDENRIIVPLDQVAPVMQKAQIAIEDSRFYEHGGVDVRGVVRALVSNASGAGQHLGWVHADAAVRQADPARHRPQGRGHAGRPGRGHPARPRRSHPQAPGAEVLDPAREGAVQGPDPPGLPQHRLLRRPGLRRAGGGEALLQQGRQGPQPHRVGPHRRPRPEPRHHRPGEQPRAGHRPTQRRPRPDARAGTHHRQGDDRRQGGQARRHAQGDVGADGVPGRR